MGVAPKVSVIIPCYNLGRYLDEAVDSVLAQTFHDFEILIVNDGSTDPETNRLLVDYRRPKTRVIHSDNRGLSGARNLGIQQATGMYICALDADDLLEPTLFEKSVRVLDEDPSMAFVSHWLRTFGDEEREWTPERCDFPALLDMNTVNGAALVRRDALLAVGLFDESMRVGCEDWDLWITLVERGFPGTILPEFLFRYRQRADSMSRLMAKGGMNIELYRYLGEKHAGSYRRHFWQLFLRRATIIGELLRHAYERELEEERWLDPELTKKRERLEALRAKAVKVERERQREAERTRMGATIAELEAGRAAARREAAELRRSLSWRVTAPLRTVYGWLLRVTGGD